MSTDVDDGFAFFDNCKKKKKVCDLWWKVNGLNIWLIVNMSSKSYRLQNLVVDVTVYCKVYFMSDKNRE